MFLDCVTLIRRQVKEYLSRDERNPNWKGSFRLEKSASRFGLATGSSMHTHHACMILLADDGWTE